MSWSTPPTAVTGTIIPASFWNNYIVNNFAQTETGVIISAGQFPVAIGANSVSKISAIYEYDIVGTDGTIINPYTLALRAYIYSSTAQSITFGGTEQLFTFDTVSDDSDSMANLGTHNERLTCNTPGLYLISSGVVFDAFTGSAINPVIYLKRYNSSNTVIDTYAAKSNLLYGLDESAFNLNCFMTLASGDYVRFLYSITGATTPTGNTSHTHGAACKYLFAKKVSS